MQVTDAQATPAAATQAYALAVNPALSITTVALPNAYLTRIYSATVAITGGQGPYSFSLASGALPAGLLMTPSTGAIGGQPTILSGAVFMV